MSQQWEDCAPTQIFGSLGPLSRNQFQRAADKYNLGHVISAELLGGSYRNNVRLITAKGDWVLRGVTAPVTLEDLRRERFFARTLYQRSSIESPWPYLLDEESGIFGWPYSIMRFLPGKVLHPAAPGVDWRVVGSGLGKAAAKLHAIDFPCYGNWQPDLDKITCQYLLASEWFYARFLELKQRVAQSSSPLDPCSDSWSESLVQDALPVIDGFVPTYIHGDLGLGNLVGRRTSSGFAFTGVFDLASGFAGDPDEDLAIPLWWPLYWGNATASRAFFTSYSAERPPRPGQRLRLHAYLLMSLLTNWELGQRQGFDWYKGCRSFRDWAEPLSQQALSALDENIA
jgi:aminoglycoside phosphotransferase (APT) family kinase protein